MAIIHKATIRPTKPELLEQLLGGPVTVLGAYRFDDPDGAVGVEALIARCGADTRQVVLAYRGAPLEGAEDRLVSTMEHSALGRRWIYDGSRDPVALACFHRALRGEQEQAVEEVWDGDARIATRESTARLSVEGDGDPGPGATLAIAGRLDPADAPAAQRRLRAAWEGGTAVVATLT